MRSARIARLEFRRVSRSRGLWIASALFALSMAGVTAIPQFVLADAEPESGVAFFLGPATDVVLPIVAILLSYAAISGQRERGSIKLLLATPHRRDDVLGGAILARTLVIWLILTLGVVLSVASVVLLYGLPSARPVAAFSAWSALVAASYVVIGVSVSAASATRTQSATLLIAAYVLAHVFWEPMARGMHYLLVGGLPGASPPRWYEILLLANPLEAYTHVAQGVLPPSPHLAVAVEQGSVQAAAGDVVGGSLSTGDFLISFVVITGWATIAVLLARLRFGSADLR